MADVELAVADCVATVTLNRPERLNAVTPSMGVLFDEVVAAVDADPEVRVVVLTGAGRAFCAGADLAYLADEDTAREGLQPDEGLHPDRLLRLRKPVIAAVNGPAAGLGFVLALMADIRVVALDAPLVTSFARLGLVAEYGTSWLLPRLIGPGAALDLLLTARRTTGAEARELGLAQRAVPAEDVLSTAHAMAADIVAGCAPSALAAIKAQVRADLEGTFAGAYERAGDLMLASFGTPDVVEGIAAQQERRAPRFAPLAPSEG